MAVMRAGDRWAVAASPTARVDITLAPGIVALAVPLLGVSACRVVARLLRAAARPGR